MERPKNQKGQELKKDNYKPATFQAFHNVKHTERGKVYPLLEPSTTIVLAIVAMLHASTLEENPNSLHGHFFVLSSLLWSHMIFIPFPAYSAFVTVPNYGRGYDSFLLRVALMLQTIGLVFNFLEHEFSAWQWDPQTMFAPYFALCMRMHMMFFPSGQVLMCAAFEGDKAKPWLFAVAAGSAWLGFDYHILGLKFDQLQGIMGAVMMFSIGRYCWTMNRLTAGKNLGSFVALFLCCCSCGPVIGLALQTGNGYLHMLEGFVAIVQFRIQDECLRHLEDAGAVRRKS